MKPITPLLLTFLLMSGILGAQQAPSPGSLRQKVLTQYTEKTGLPSNTVLGILQDHQGYLWMACYEGLVRFDGLKVTLINRQTSNTFLGNSARVLMETPDHQLFIGTNTDGLGILIQGKFRMIGSAEGLQNLSIRALTQEASGLLWIGTAGGLFTFDGQRVQKYQTGLEKDLGIINLLHISPQGAKITASNSPGLWEITPSGVKPYLKDKTFQDRIFFAVAEDPTGTLWLGTGLGEILQVKDRTVVSVFQHPLVKGYAINDFYLDKQNTLWVSTDRGILLYNGGQYQAFEPDLESFKDVIYSVREDREGNLWIATKSNGLFKISKSKFSNLGVPEGLIQASVNALEVGPQGELWVGTDGGVSLWQGEAFRDHLVVKTLKDSRTRHIYRDAQNVLWFSTYSSKGLVRYGPEGLREFTEKDGLPISRVRLVFQDQKGRHWIGTTAGLALMENQKITRVYNLKDGLTNQFIMALEEDDQGQIWIGTDGGGVGILGLDGKIQIYDKKAGLPGAVIFRFFKDSQHRMWVATSEGISLWDGKGFKTITAKQGLMSDTIFQILEDGDKNLWLITTKGIQILALEDLIKAAQGSPEKLSGRILDKRDGLAGQITSTAWAAKGPDGNVYFPTLAGVSTLNLKNQSINNNPPPVLIELMDLDGKNLDLGTLTQLPPGQSRLNIDFTALSFQVPEKVRFQYFLDGYDKTWSPLLSDRKATYTNLPPGDFVFRVRAINNDGIPSAGEAVQKFSKLPHFYESPLFYILAGGLLVGLGFGINFQRTRILQRNKIELQRLVAERTRDLESEKAKTEALLLNIFPPAVAQELKEKGAATPETFEDVTVLFADLVDFTTQTANMEPALVISELNEIFGAFDAIMAGQDCERIKTIGDAYLAVCGMPQPQPENALRLARAALDMRSWLEHRNEIRPIKWKIRIGMHSGRAVGGVVGLKRYVYDIFGDTINTASRMETHSLPMKINVSEATAQKLTGLFHLQERPPENIKGKGAMKMFFLEPRE